MKSATAFVMVMAIASVAVAQNNAQPTSTYNNLKNDLKDLFSEGGIENTYTTKQSSTPTNAPKTNDKEQDKSKGSDNKNNEANPTAKSSASSVHNMASVAVVGISVLVLGVLV